MSIFNKKKNAGLTESQIKFKRRKKTRKVFNTLMALVIFFGLLGCLCGASFVYIILNKSDVELNLSDLNNTEMSVIYDDKGEKIAELGYELRVNVPYSCFPQSLVDAFIAVEDSRYFEHNGFDTPRFAKAFLENLKTLSFSQGGSTLTMQTVKNTYFGVDTIAEKSIPRKVQEIYYSIKISKLVSKEKLLELYINKINYGGTARGVQVASEYYFGKDCTDLNLVECAMLAGIVNQPNGYNPYFHLEDCIDRTHEVLYLMNYHGYITDEEYALAKKVDIAKLLVGNKAESYEDGTTIPNQAYIDVVLDEIETKYGIDPYVTPCRIYTAMNQIVQDYCDSVSNGEVITFKDQYCNIAFTAVQNYTGLIVGICGGRNYNRARMFNYATDGRMQPGSTSKTMGTYPLAFEYCGLATSYCFFDEPLYWMGTNILVVNDTHVYYGDLTVQKAFTNSYNIPSVKLYRWLQEVIGNKKISEHFKNLGFDPFMYNNANEQYALGGSNFIVSPVQMAAAESAWLSGGLYTEPHTITRIEFINSTRETIVANPEQRQVLSAGAAWLTTYEQMLVSMGQDNDISEYYYSQRGQIIRQKGYNTYAKTGTTNVDSSYIKAYNMNDNASKEQWLVFGTNDYGCALWWGYDYSKHVDSKTYVSPSDAAKRYDAHVGDGLLKAIEQAYGKPVNKRVRPSTVVKMTHIKGLYPYTALPSWADSKYAITGWILSKYAHLEEYTLPTICSLFDGDLTVKSESSTNNQYIHINVAEYPDVELTQVSDGKIEIEAQMSKSGEPKKFQGDKFYDVTFICGPIHYFVEILDSDGKYIWGNDYDTNNITIDIRSINRGYLVQQDTDFIVRVYYKYTVAPVQSNALESRVTISPFIPEEPPIDDPVDPVDPEPIV